MMKRYILFILICFLTYSLYAQTFKGRVIDFSGTPIPYAALYLKELKTGFTTDANGSFQASLPPGNYTCEVSSLGFAGQTFTLSVSVGDVEKNIVLSEQIYSLREVNIVKGTEDPAYAVMRKAIANAPYYRTQVKSFKAGTYLKGTGKMKTIPAILKLSKEVRKESKELLGKLFVMEEQREVTFTAPSTWENHVKAYSNSFPDELEVRIGLTTINFYEPTIFEKVSPLSTGAFSYYRFQLEGCYSEGGHLINKIKVIPKQDNPRLVSGDIYIVEDLWCVSAAELSVRMSGLKATVKATCKEVQPSVFLATSTSMSCEIKVMGFSAEASYLAAVHYTDVKVVDRQQIVSGVQVSSSAVSPKQSRKQQKLAKQIEELSAKEDLTLSEAYKLSKMMEKTISESDTTHSRHKYERKVIGRHENVKTDSLAGKKDSLYWAAIRSVPLRPEEVQSYVHKEKLSLTKDSTHRGDSDESSVGGKIVQTFLVGKTFRTSNKKAWLTLKGLPSYIPEYNFVDGFWLGAKFDTGLKLSETATINFSPSVYYTSARKSVVGQGILSLDYAPRRRGHLAFSGGVLSADYNGESGESRLINAAASSFFGRNDVKLYDKRFLSVDHQIELVNSLLFSATLSWQRRRMLENHIHQSWFKKEVESNIPDSRAFRPMPENELLRATFALEYTPAHYYHMSRGKKVYDDSRFPTFTLRYDRAFPLKGSLPSSSYHLAEFSVRQSIEFGMFNILDWALNAGTFWNTDGMQFPDFKHFATTGLPVTERSFDSGFSLLDNYAYSIDTRWAQANISWYTPYLLLKYLPFLKNKNLDEALHIRSLVGYDRLPYSEIGYSIGFMKLARLGVFVGFNNLKYRSAGVSVSIPMSMLVRE